MNILSPAVVGVNYGAVLSFVLFVHVFSLVLAGGIIQSRGSASDEDSMVAWIITGVVLAVALGLTIYLRQRKRKRELRQFYWEHKGRFYRYSLKQLENEISGIGGKKRELEHRLEIFSKAHPRVRVTLLDEGYFDFDSIESQMRHIMGDLEELDRQEGVLKEVLADKRTGKDYSDLFR